MSFILLLFSSTISVLLFNVKAEEHFTSNSPYKVLHVSVFKQNELQKIVDSVGASALFTITQVSVEEFNKGNPLDLTVYDAIVFGINDWGEVAGDRNRKYDRLTELQNYVSNGGGIVWTHDTLEQWWDYGPQIEEPAGVDNYDISDKNRERVWYSSIKIVEDHPVLHHPYEIGNVGDIINVQYTHTNGGRIKTAKAIIKSYNGRYESQATEANDFYLTVNEYGKGRVVIIEMGHSTIREDKPTVVNIPSEKESKILVNALWWCCAQTSRLYMTFVKFNETYTYYYKYTFNCSWYEAKAEELAKEAWKSLFELTYKPAIETLLLELIPKILQPFATSIDIASTTYQLLTSYSSFLTGLKCSVIAGKMCDFPYYDAYSALSNLLQNTNELINYAEKSDVQKVKQLLNERKTLLENLYTKTKVYNDHLVNSIKLMADCTVFESQYPAIRYILDTLRSVLKNDYEVTTYYLDGSPKRLSELSNALLGELVLTELPSLPFPFNQYKLYAFNTFESIGESRVYEISISEDEAKEDWFGLLKPRLNIKLLVPSEVEFELYIRYAAQPTRDVYDQKQSNSGKSNIYLTIEPKAGKYYVMITSAKGFGGYTIEVTTFKSICLFVWCACPVNILVTDFMGRRVGYDILTNSTINEIEGANYSGPYSTPQVVTITDPHIGNYSVHVYGWSAGSYTLKVASTTLNGTIIEAFSLQGQIANQEEKICNFTLDIKSQLIQSSVGVEFVNKKFYAGIWYGKNYYVHTFSNSSVTNFMFNETNRLMRFFASGPSQTNGMCIIYIPKELMWGRFSLYIDGNSLTEGVDYTIDHNATHYNFILYYSHSTREIEIRSEYAVNEFSHALTLTLSMLIATISLALLKIKPKKKSKGFKS